MTYSTKTISLDTRVRFFWTLLISVFLISGFYMYSVSATAMNTASRKQLEEERAILATKISEMEFQYIALKNDVSIEVAFEHGFKEVIAPRYVSRSSSNSLTLNR
ncbi:MAG: hypothetical protein WD874_00680 [Parcubacteria group bacterium]